MKLHHFTTSEPAQKLRNLGKALVKPAQDPTMPVAEARKPIKRAEPAKEETTSGMDAAIHALTQDHKHLHKKLAIHD